MTTPKTMTVRAIEPGHLDQIRGHGGDGHGNALEPFPACGAGEPLRCCLRYADPGESIAVISYAPFAQPSVWREVGPVYVHAQRCRGYADNERLPSQLSRGPRVLRTYRADNTMDYDHIHVVTDDADLEPIVRRLLDGADVATVHVRTLAPQCFLYAVRLAAS